MKTHPQRTQGQKTALHRSHQRHLPPLWSACCWPRSGSCPIWGLPTSTRRLPGCSARWWSGLIGFVSVAYWGLFLNIVTKRHLPGANRFRGLTVKLFLPVMVLLGRLLGGWTRSPSCSPSSASTTSWSRPRRAATVPRTCSCSCPTVMQSSKCDRRLTYDINNCKRCGLCPIAGAARPARRLRRQSGHCHGRHHRPAHRGPDAPAPDHRRGLLPRSGQRHPGRLSPARVRRAQRAAPTAPASTPWWTTPSWWPPCTASCCPNIWRARLRERAGPSPRPRAPACSRSARQPCA